MAEPGARPDTLAKDSPPTETRSISRLRWLQNHLKLLGGIITAVASIGLIIKGLLGYFDVYHLASEFRHPAQTLSTPQQLQSDHVVSPVVKAARLSIAIVPFENLSLEPGRETLAQAITQAVAVYLSHVPDYVAKTVSAADQKKNPQSLKQEYGVNYVLQGSVQHLKDKARISVQLVDANDGAQLWTDHFEDSAADAFDVEDAIAGRISNSLDIEIIKAANERLDKDNAAKKDAQYYAIKGREAFHKLRTKENLVEAQTLFQQALALNPDQFDALVFLPLALDFEILNFADEHRDEKAKLAVKVADRAIQLNPTSGIAHGAKAQSYTPYGRYLEWIQECETAISLNPSLSQPRVLLAAGKFRTGEFEAAIVAGKQAIRLSPKDPGIAFAPLHIGNSYAGLRDYQEALKWLEYMRSISPLVWRARASLAVAYALQGNIDAAQTELAEARRLNPALTINVYKETLSFKKPAIPSKEDRFIEFSERSAQVLRDLGLPD